MDPHLDRLARLLPHSSDRRSLFGGVIAAGLAVVGARPRAHATAPANGGLVFDYYQAIDRRDFKSAYGYLGSIFKSRQTLAQFAAGFADTVHDDLKVERVQSDAAHGRVVYDVAITAWHKDRTIHRFAGTYTEGREGGSTRLIDAAISEVASPEMPPLCAASDLTATISGDAGAGSRFATITVTNQAGGSCVLGGIPKVAVSDAAGRTVITARPEPDVLITTVTLAPGDSATLAIRWSNWCDEALSGEPLVSVAFRGGNGRIAELGGLSVPPCLSEPGGKSTLSVRPWEKA
jgi:hypothetical protein